MNKLNYIKATLVAGCMFALLPEGYAQIENPNIVLIMADDLGYECIGANGGTSYQTPVLDKLAATGVRFEHCYSQPLCTPSRVQIMTGMYNVRNYTAFGVLDQGSRQLLLTCSSRAAMPPASPGSGNSAVKRTRHSTSGLIKPASGSTRFQGPKVHMELTAVS